MTIAADAMCRGMCLAACAWLCCAYALWSLSTLVHVLTNLDDGAFTADGACSCLHSLCCICCVVTQLQRSSASALCPLAKVEYAGQEANYACIERSLLPSVHTVNPYMVAGMDCPRVRYPQLNDVVEADLAEQGYQVLTDAGQQVDKVIQLYEVTA